MKIAHIINPVKADESSDLYIAQPITFESMRKAKQEAAGEIRIDLLTTQYPEDRPVIPDYFTILPDLERSVLDFRPFSKPRKLPLIQDILNRLSEYSDADYFIFTNADIGLMPDFYVTVKKYLDSGLDALIINRRIIGKKNYQGINDLPLIYEDRGKPHPGFDCFVFHRELLTRFRLDYICVGIPFVGVTLAHNLFAAAKNIKLLDREHLTFHIGTEIMPQRDQEYYWYNRKQFDMIYKEYFEEYLKLGNIPYADLNIITRYWKWIRNPSLFIFKLIKLECREVMKKIGF